MEDPNTLQHPLLLQLTLLQRRIFHHLTTSLRIPSLPSSRCRPTQIQWIPASRSQSFWRVILNAWTPERLLTLMMNSSDLRTEPMKTHPLRHLGIFDHSLGIRPPQPPSPTLKITVVLNLILPAPNFNLKLALILPQQRRCRPR